MREDRESGLQQARADLLQSLKDDDAVNNPPRFLARIERLVEIKIAESLEGYQRAPLRFR